LSDFLDVLASDAKSTIASGYYASAKITTSKNASLKAAIQTAKQQGKNAIICEVKAASPSAGSLRSKMDPTQIAKAIAKGGATCISVLTEPKHFKGSLTNLAAVRAAVDLPILFKDFIIDSQQLECASRMGVNAVLLIQALFDRGYCAENTESMIAQAHARGLEVLLESHNEREFTVALKSHPDLIGINNRNLGTLQVDLNVTNSILKKKSKEANLVVSESGINTPRDIRQLRQRGADAFLIGSSIMLSEDIELKVKELVQA